MDAIAPHDPSKGYNRMKLWVACLLWAIQYYIKMEVVNSNFSDITRIPLIVSSMLFTIIGTARLQFQGIFDPFGKDINYAPHVMGASALICTNALIIFNGQKKIQRFLILESINRVEKEHELQSILFAYEGANVLFQNSSVRFINRSCEKVFVSSSSKLKSDFECSS